MADECDPHADTRPTFVQAPFCRFPLDCGRQLANTYPEIPIQAFYSVLSDYCFKHPFHPYPAPPFCVRQPFPTTIGFHSSSSAAFFFFHPLQRVPSLLPWPSPSPAPSTPVRQRTASATKTSILTLTALIFHRLFPSSTKFNPRPCMAL